MISADQVANTVILIIGMGVVVALLAFLTTLSRKHAKIKAVFCSLMLFTISNLVFFGIPVSPFRHLFAMPSITNVFFALLMEALICGMSRLLYYVYLPFQKSAK